RDVIGEQIVTGEGEVDNPGELFAEEEYVVGKQVGMDEALRQGARPDAAFEESELGGNEVTQAVLHLVGARGRGFEQRPPARYRQRIGARHGETGSREMHLRQRLADTGAMGCV